MGARSDGEPTDRVPTAVRWEHGKHRARGHGPPKRVTRPGKRLVTWHLQAIATSGAHCVGAGCGDGHNPAVCRVRWGVSGALVVCRRRPGPGPACPVVVDSPRRRVRCGLRPAEPVAPGQPISDLARRCVGSAGWRSGVAVSRLLATATSEYRGFRSWLPPRLRFLARLATVHQVRSLPWGDSQARTVTGPANVPVFDVLAMRRWSPAGSSRRLCRPASWSYPLGVTSAGRPS